MEFGLAHRAFQTQKEPVVETGWIVDAVLVEDQSVGESANLQQAVPVGIVPRQPGHFEAHDDAGVPHADVGHQALKTAAPGRRRAGLALVAVDDDDLLVAPAECGRAAAQRVLPLCALDVFDDLSHRRLPDVQVSAALEMMGLDFGSLVHGVLR